MKYFKNIFNGEIKVLYTTISNGNILTDICKDTGSPLDNDCYQAFVSDFELTSEWEPCIFNVKTNTNENTKKALNTLVFTLVDTIKDYELDNLQDFELIEHKVNLIDKVIFDDSLQSIKDVDTLVKEKFRRHYPQELADDYIYAGQDIMYYVLFNMRNSIRSFINEIKEKE